VGVIKTIIVAFSMFSRVPMPHTVWDEKNMRYMLCAFPLVGVVIGACLLLWVQVCRWLSLGTILYAAGITLIPIAVTGGIHLDGFCDTADALASQAPTERRREILKDPHAGAFAVIGLCVYMLAYFAAATELKMTYAAAAQLGVMHVLSRAMSGMSSICFPAGTSEGLLAAFRSSAPKKNAAAILFAVYIAAAAGMIWGFGISGAVMAAVGILCMLWLYVMSKRKFGGMSGDLAGWFLQTAELCMLAALIITERAAAL